MTKFFHSLLVFIISTPVITALIGAIVYFLYGLNKTGVYLTVLFSAIAIIIIIKLALKDHLEQTFIKNIKKSEWIIFGLFLLNFFIAFWFLYKAQSDRAIITPWQVVSYLFFLTYALGVILLLILSRSSSKLLTPSLILQSLLLFGVAAIVYKLGYGFDPFVHEAAVRAIEQFGQIKPMTPYYLGQYSLMTVLHNLTTIDLAIWSKILVSGLAIIILPLMIIRWLKNHHGHELDWGLAAVMLLIMPATVFIITTPQSLAYLFLLIVIFWPSPKTTTAEKVIIWFSALAALVTQPIAGIPAVLLALIDTLKNKKIDKIIYPLIITAFVLALPLAFYIFSSLDANTGLSLSLPNLKFLNNFIPINPNKTIWWLNFTYFYNSLWGIIILILSIIGIKLSFLNGNTELRRRFAWPSLALIIAATITSMINFHFLINYERSDYTDRLIIVALLFALPLIINTFRELASLIEKLDSFRQISWLIIITAAATASLYLSYPRFDRYYNSHGYASSKADSLATKWIEENSHNEPYVVLANQQVSAAALRNYGFKNYYQNNIFYYPVPTGGELYKKYLAMVDEPSLEIIKQTRDLTGVKQVYLVLDSYWWNFQKLADEIYLLANETKNIGEGQVIVFKFSR